VLEPERLLAAYASGYFPMAESHQGAVRWYSPDPRAVIPLEGLRVSRSLRQTLHKGAFTIRLNTSFEHVMRCCAQREETWISEEIIASYRELNRLGYAHSVEAWKERTLAGGLYGVALGAAFFGESMFSTVRDASKVALVYLVGHLKERAYRLLDVQFLTPHLVSLGAMEIPREEYLGELKTALALTCTFT
jgi:leucyl/phenylalanyl-tRNA--protein transferase